MKKLIKSIIFIVLFFCIWNYIFSILWLNENGIAQFYHERKNSLDIIYLGASNAYVHFNPVLAYNEYGFTTGMLSNGNQQPSAIKYLLEEVQKRQKPKLYIIDISYAFTYQDNPAYVRRVTDALKPSINRYNAINDLLSYTNVPKEDYSSYYFSFLTYHNNWKNISKSNYYEDTMFKGHLLSEETISIVPQKDHEWISKKEAIPKKIDNIFEDLISYIKSKKLNVVFVLAPKVYSDESMGILNNIEEKITSNDLEVWNLKYLDNLNIDYSHDLYNDLHLNVWGTTKFTLVFGKYLKDKYNLPNHKDDEKYESWNSEYKRYKDYYKKLTSQNFEDYLKNLYDS